MRSWGIHFHWCGLITKILKSPGFLPPTFSSVAREKKNHPILCWQFQVEKTGSRSASNLLWDRISLIENSFISLYRKVKELKRYFLIPICWEWLQLYPGTLFYGLFLFTSVERLCKKENCKVNIFTLLFFTSEYLMIENNCLKKKIAENAYIYLTYK